MSDCLYSECSNFSKLALECCTPECLNRLLHMSNVQAIRSCGSCKHIIAGNSAGTALCDRKEVKGGVSTWPITCREARTSVNKCTKYAVYFEEK